MWKILYYHRCIRLNWDFKNNINLSCSFAIWWPIFLQNYQFIFLIVEQALDYFFIWLWKKNTYLIFKKYSRMAIRLAVHWMNFPMPFSDWPDKNCYQFIHKQFIQLIVGNSILSTFYMSLKFILSIEWIHDPNSMWF